MAHPTLDVDEIDGEIDGDNIVITIKYAPSGFLGNRYTTRVNYGLSEVGIASAQVTFDDTFFAAFTGLELIKEVAVELAHEARKSQDEDVRDAAGLLEIALSQNISGTQLHLLIVKLLWWEMRRGPSIETQVESVGHRNDDSGALPERKRAVSSSHR